MSFEHNMSQVADAFSRDEEVPHAYALLGEKWYEDRFKDQFSRLLVRFPDRLTAMNLMLYDTPEALDKYLSEHDQADTQSLFIFATRCYLVRGPMLECLLRKAKGLDLDQKVDGKTALHFLMRELSSSSVSEKTLLLIKQGASLLSTDDKLKTPLQIAMERPYVPEIWPFLIQNYTELVKGVAPDALGNALLQCAENHNWGLVNTLIDFPSISVNHCLNYRWDNDTRGYFTLHFLVQGNQRELIKKLIDRWPEVANQQLPPEFPTALILASQDPRVEVTTFECLLENAHNIDFEATAKGETALHCALKTDQMGKVRLLVRYGANLSAKTSNEQTVIQMAAFGLKWDLLKILVTDRGPSKGDPEGFGDALLCAAYHQKWEIAGDLCSMPNIATNRFFEKGATRGYYALHFLVLANQRELLERYLETQKEQETQPSFVNQQTGRSPTALTLACYDSRVTLETLACLLEHAKDLNLNQKDGSGRTALHHLAELCREEKSIEKAVCLVQHGADVMIKDGKDRTPIALAEARNGKSFIQAIQLQAYLAEQKDLSKTKLKGLWITTGEQLEYVLKYKGGSLSRTGCVLHPNVNVADYRLDDIGLTLCDLSVRQYTDLVFSHLPPDSKKPDLLMCPVDLRQNIRQLENRDFIELLHWLRTLLACFTPTGTPPPRQLINDETMASKILANSLCSPSLLPRLGMQLSAMITQRADTRQSSVTRELLGQLNRSQKESWNIRLDFLFELLTLNRDAILSLSPQDQTFQLCLVAICLLVRSGYPRVKLFSKADDLTHIGAYQKSIEDLDIGDLIIVGSAIDTAKILVVDEVIARLRESESFQDPVTLSPLNEDEIKACLSHPKIAAEVKALHDAKLGGAARRGLSIDDRIEEVVEKLTELRKQLWNASTDSGPHPFDSKGADNAIIDFIDYVNMLPESVMQVLNRLEYYVVARSSRVSFENLFKDLSYDGCAGQLGVAIHQWTSAFEKAKSVLREPMLSSPPTRSCYSKYIEMIPASLAVPEAYRDLPKTDGKDFAGKLPRR